MQFLTEDNKVIPEANIVRTYKKGTCDYKVLTACPRCFGRGVVGNYGVCFRCNGQCKELVKKKGYTSDQLAIYLNNIEVQKAKFKEQQQKIDNSVEVQIAQKRKKKALQLQILVSCGGNGSDFASSLSSQMWLIMSGQKSKPFTEKQLIWVFKFLEKGCIMKDQPFDKVSHYVNTNL